MSFDSVYVCDDLSSDASFTLTESCNGAGQNHEAVPFGFGLALVDLLVQP
jgi:hypothetical protein